MPIAPSVSAKHVARGAATAAAMFVLLGTVAALWNKLLVVLIGSALLLEYFEPVRIYVALGGAVLVALAVWLKLARPECMKAQAGSASA